MQTISEFKKQFDKRLAAFLKQRLKIYRHLGKGSLVPNFIEQNSAIALGGGKRLRPYVATLMYETCGGKNRKDIEEVALGLELLHLFLLAHDDIVDRGSLRHSLPTAHVFAQTLLRKHSRRGDITHIGQSQGMLASDLLWIWSQDCIVGNGKLSSNRISALQAVRKMTDEVFVGEMLDVDSTTMELLSAPELRRVHILKTVQYSFVGPIQTGARLAGLSNKWDTFTKQFGQAVGLGFQIQDDVLDIISTKEQKSVLVDLQNRQHTCLTNFVFAKAGEKYKKELNKLFGKPLPKNGYNRVRQLFTESGAVEAALKEAKKHFAQAHQLLEQNNFPKKYLPLWQELVSVIEHRA